MSRDDHHGVAHKIASVALRLFELSCAIIVLGILARFSYLISIVQVNADGRIVYAMVVAGIGIIFSFFFCPPFNALFMSFPFDFIMFILWLVAFCLLETKTGSNACSSRWYNDYWGYYWGRFWVTGPIGTVRVGRTGCGEWRSVLAFSFMAMFAHLLSGILGIYVFHNYVQVKETARDVKRHAEKLSGRHPQENGYEQAREVENGPPNVPQSTGPPPQPPMP
ncbi:hypothetical protein PT974_05467 [Cladobotryum mycophilum]|uniref:MARVEL domain-containing protein n=1 Tax=Cladobotryum mycophilum TaxID=491253 RepID=A0ABR0SJX7_9HYPO